MTFIDKQDDLFINDSRFEIGMKLFNSCQWYKSHDVFEDFAFLKKNGYCLNKFAYFFLRCKS